MSIVQEKMYMDVDDVCAIAQNYMPSDMDTRKAVYELCQVNDISASELYAGNKNHFVGD